MAAKRALITGIGGQDGSYLAELLLAKGYRVYGLVSQGRGWRWPNIAHIRDRISLIRADLCDFDTLVTVLKRTRPQEAYNLAGQSSSVAAMRDPVRTGNINGLGPVGFLEAIRRASPHTRFFQASSAEMFGTSKDHPQRLTTRFSPATPYGVAKLYAHGMLNHYRTRYGVFAVSGILFNHESPRRQPEFVTRKISMAAAAGKRGSRQRLRLGNLEAARDWGFAGDYVVAMWLSLQYHEPHDYIIATGKTHTVRQFVSEAFAAVGLDWRKHVAVDDALVRDETGYRPCGDASLARRQLGWRPQTQFRDLVRRMVHADLGRWDMNSDRVRFQTS